MDLATVGYSLPLLAGPTATSAPSALVTVAGQDPIGSTDATSVDTSTAEGTGVTFTPSQQLLSLQAQEEGTLISGLASSASGADPLTAALTSMTTYQLYNRAGVGLDLAALVTPPSSAVPPAAATPPPDGP